MRLEMRLRRAAPGGQALAGRCAVECRGYLVGAKPGPGAARSRRATLEPLQVRLGWPGHSCRPLRAAAKAITAEATASSRDTWLGLVITTTAVQHAAPIHLKKQALTCRRKSGPDFHFGDFLPCGDDVVSTARRGLCVLRIVHTISSRTSTCCRAPVTPSRASQRGRQLDWACP